MSHTLLANQGQEAAGPITVRLRRAPAPGGPRAGAARIGSADAVTVIGRRRDRAGAGRRRAPTCRSALASSGRLDDRTLRVTDAASESESISSPARTSEIRWSTQPE
eukprot:758847-Hanusia_phi.AAC.1